MSRASVLHEIRGAIAEAGIRGRFEMPQRPAGPSFGAHVREQFIERLEAHACTWEAVESLAALPARVSAWLAAQGLAPRIALARPLASLDWPDNLQRHVDAAGIDECAAVSLAFAGIAETGSLAMYSGPDSPITHNYVPEFHLVAIRSGDICDNQEAVWARVRATGAMPRALNLIAGPSRTGDVEQTIQIGAHGPRKVHVVIVEGELPPPAQREDS